MGSTRPFFSIAIASLNVESSIESALQSVFVQDCADWELIVVDGGSEDGTIKILEKYRGQISFWDSMRDGGVYFGLNRAVQKARGEWIYFLGSDDRLHDEGTLTKVKNSLAALSEQFLVAYGRVIRFDSRGQDLYSLGEPWDLTRKKLKSRSSIPHQGTFMRRDFLSDIGGFPTRWAIAADYAVIVEAVSLKPPLFLPFVVARQQVGGLSTNPSTAYQANLEILKIQVLQSGRLPSLYAVARLILSWVQTTLEGKKVKKVWGKSP